MAGGQFYTLSPSFGPSLPPPNWPMSAEWFWLTLFHSPMPLTGGQSQLTMLSEHHPFSLSLPLSRCLLSPPFRVYSAIVSRTGDQSANSRPQPHEQRGPHGRRRLLVSNNHSSEKMGAQTETTMRAESPIRQRRRLAFFVI